MASRSRGGCIDCKKAKVKCDEVHPRCGTCHRRGYVCQGYLRIDDKSSTVPKVTLPTTNLIASTPVNIPPSPALSVATKARPVNLTHEVLENPSSTSNHDFLSIWIPGANKTLARRNTSTDEDDRQNQDEHLKQLEQSSQALPYLNSISSLPPGIISSYDGSIIEVYFSRHPINLVISSEFVEEMNANVLKVFYNDPQAVCDSLSAIGHMYMGLDLKSTMVPVLNRKARILRRLREMSNSSQDLEKTVVLLLGLCALELIDGKSQPRDTALPALIANTAFSINYYVSEGKELTSVAKYFIRAIARQDIIISLTYSRRSLVAIDTWLDEECAKQPDRFMGYTGTMMPILADLSALAEDIKRDSSAGKALTGPSTATDTPDSTLACLPSGYSTEKRAAELCTRIKEWRPMSNPKFSFQSSKIFLFHARSFQAAALLYLHRLLHPPGSSDSADDTAITMAHDVLMYISGTPSELKMSLWPVFIAATELLSEEDRNTAVQVYDMIFMQRGTVTSRRTKEFTIERVWKARDSGMDWNWMVLACQYPGECMPI